MDRILTRWRKVPYLHSSLIWTLAILLLGDWIGGSYFQSDFHLRYAFMCIAVSAVYFIHVLIYKRKTPTEVRVAQNGKGVLVSFCAVGRSCAGQL